MRNVMKKMTIPVALAALAAMWAGCDGDGKPSNDSPAGTWKLTNADGASITIVLTQNGNNITGTYDDGTVRGTVTGLVPYGSGDPIDLRVDTGCEGGTIYISVVIDGDDMEGSTSQGGVNRNIWGTRQ